jgi:mono/diheme cytochrome c family protein
VRWWLRIALIVLLAVAAVIALRLHVAGGTEFANAEVTAGRRLAEAWCSECHAIAPGRTSPRKGAPDFISVARRPSTTALALKVFLRSQHETMPNFIVAPPQAGAIVAYMLSLRR